MKLMKKSGFSSVLRKKTPPGGGRLVRCERYGKVYFRRAPVEYRDACTAAQQLQRGRMPASIAFYRTLRDTPVPLIWQRAAVEAACSGYNLFVRHNINAFACDGSISDYAKITLSTGRLDLPEHVTATVGGGEVCVRWDVPAGLAAARREDTLVAAVIYADAPFEVFFLPVEGITRERGEARLPVDDSGSGALHLYVFFRSGLGNLFSVQRYFCLNRSV
ncbi:MAG: hypothetical protein K2O69_00845 [Odoribacter sp.]|nr:hypothetical protein [Odoribacter sp.]